MVDPMCLCNVSRKFQNLIQPFINDGSEINKMNLKIVYEKFTERNVENFLKLCQNLPTDCKNSEVKEICEIAKMFQADQIYNTGLQFVRSNIDPNFSVPDQEFDESNGQSFLVLSALARKVHHVSDFGSLEFENENNNTQPSPLNQLNNLHNQNYNNNSSYNQNMPNQNNYQNIQNQSNNQYVNQYVNQTQNSNASSNQNFTNQNNNTLYAQNNNPSLNQNYQNQNNYTPANNQFNSSMNQNNQNQNNNTSSNQITLNQNNNNTSNQNQLSGRESRGIDPTSSCQMNINNSGRNSSAQISNQENVDPNANNSHKTNEKVEKTVHSAVYEIKTEPQFMKLPIIHFIADGEVVMSAKHKDHTIVIGKGETIHLNKDRTNHIARITMENGINRVNCEGQEFHVTFVFFSGPETFSIAADFMHEGKCIHWKPKEPKYNKEHNTYTLSLHGEYHHFPLKSTKNTVLINDLGSSCLIIRKVAENEFEAECNPTISKTVIFALALSQIIGPNSLYANVMRA